jgi:hypothetical protein
MFGVWHWIRPSSCHIWGQGFSHTCVSFMRQRWWFSFHRDSSFLLPYITNHTILSSHNIVFRAHDVAHLNVQGLWHRKPLGTHGGQDGRCPGWHSTHNSKFNKIHLKMWISLLSVVQVRLIGMASPASIWSICFYVQKGITHLLAQLVLPHVQNQLHYNCKWITTKPFRTNKSKLILPRFQTLSILKNVVNNIKRRNICW